MMVPSSLLISATTRNELRPLTRLVRLSFENRLPFGVAEANNKLYAVAILAKSAAVPDVVQIARDTCFTANDGAPTGLRASYELIDQVVYSRASNVSLINGKKDEFSIGFWTNLLLAIPPEEGFGKNIRCSFDQTRSLAAPSQFHGKTYAMLVYDLSYDYSFAIEAPRLFPLPIHGRAIIETDSSIFVRTDGKSSMRNLIFPKAKISTLIARGKCDGGFGEHDVGVGAFTDSQLKGGGYKFGMLGAVELPAEFIAAGIGDATEYVGFILDKVRGEAIGQVVKKFL